MIEKPNCYECVHRKDVPGDSHSSCEHPGAQSAHGNPMAKLMGTYFAKRTPIAPMPSVDGLKVSGDPHGIRRGWFAWPYNFDPVWLVECNGFKATKGE